MSAADWLDYWPGLDGRLADAARAVADTETYLEPYDQDEGEVSYRTDRHARQDSNYDWRAGREDLAEARRVAKVVRAELEDVSAKVETLPDSGWVYLTLKLRRGGR